MNTQKKILYITTIDCDSDPGVFKKINYQCKAFQSFNYAVSCGFFKGSSYMVDDEVIFTRERGTLQAIKERFIFPKEIRDFTVSFPADVFYFRKPFVNLTFVYLLYLLKSQGKKVVLEIPTYPYKKELSGLPRKLLYLFERFSTIFLRKNVDFITYFGGLYESIWGIDSLRLENGIDPDSIPMKKVKQFDSNIIRFLAVGNLSKWHGYERMLKSIHNLDEKLKEKIHIDIVGEGQAYSELQELVNIYRLQPYVTFHGFKHGNQLDDLFDIADIGVGSLGMYKIGLDIGSTLKAREFCARGLPFIIGYKDLSFNDENFFFTVSNDSEDLDLKNIMYWFENNEFSADEIRRYAVENLTWKSQMLRVVNKVNEEIIK